jgi:hypothetical protein
LCAAADRIAASTESWPPSELASAANPRTCSSLNPGIGRTLVTESSLRVRVPVLSEHSTSMVAASSTAERRVGSTPNFARERAPSAAARVKVAGNATGIAARTEVNNRGIISPHGIACIHAYTAIRRITPPLKNAKLRTIRRTVFCCELTTCAVRTNSAVRPNLVRIPVAVTCAVASPRRTSAPA